MLACFWYQGPASCSSPLPCGKEECGAPRRMIAKPETDRGVCRMRKMAKMRFHDNSYIRQSLGAKETTIAQQARRWVEPVPQPEVALCPTAIKHSLRRSECMCVSLIAVKWFSTSSSACAIHTYCFVKIVFLAGGTMRAFFGTPQDTAR